MEGENAGKKKNGRKIRIRRKIQRTGEEKLRIAEEKER